MSLDTIDLPYCVNFFFCKWSRKNTAITAIGGPSIVQTSHTHTLLLAHKLGIYNKSKQFFVGQTATTEWSPTTIFSLNRCQPIANYNTLLAIVSDSNFYISLLCSIHLRTAQISIVPSCTAVVGVRKQGNTTIYSERYQMAHERGAHSTTAENSRK